MTNASTIFEEFIQKTLPQNLTENQSHQFYMMIKCLHSSNIRTQSNIVPNGYGFLCKAETLYDHNDPMFQAAFREDSKSLQFFVKERYRGLRDYWMIIGLRQQLNSNVYLPEDYLACVRAMEARFRRIPIDNNFNSDSAKVAGYLTWDKPCLHNWYFNVWDEISKARIFTVQKGFPQESSFANHVCKRSLIDTHIARFSNPAGAAFVGYFGVNFRSSPIHRQTTCTPKFRHASILTFQSCTNISSF